MKQIHITKERLTKEVKILEQNEDNTVLKLPKQGGGIELPELKTCSERYLTFYLTVCEEHSMAFQLLVYCKKEGAEKPAFTIRFGVLGNVRAKICLDLNWMNAHILFPEASIGQQKVVCHGRRVEKEEISRVELAGMSCFHEITVALDKMKLIEEYPNEFPLPERKLVDELGQNKQKEWASKVHSAEELQRVLLKQMEQSEEGYPFEDWSAYGGWKKKKLTAGSGYFSRWKENNRWWLVDPEGNAFFSMGPDCVGINKDCRVDGLEQWLDWLPNPEDKEYAECFRKNRSWPAGEKARRECTLFSYEQANLFRVFGTDWYEKWKSMITGQLRRHGLNTLGNWSDSRLFGETKLPYVTSLPEFPGTETFIFRDFPDVFSKEYEQNAKRCAQKLKDFRDDPYMIGYFLRNEPSWAFVDHLVLADEVLYNPKQTACKEVLIQYLKEKYKKIEHINQAWNCTFLNFEQLYKPQKKVSEWSEQAYADMKEFSREMLKKYIEIPSKACRQVDSNHMILGMRWAWISDTDLVTGWENFDVFSINCYAVDPTEALQRVVELKVDLPIMIGEFHFGALDAGPTATGLEGVKTQKDRGLAYRYYCERVAAHPYGVGCHYFQCYDQFVLGRFDGENYNIGLFDICSQPYPEMMEQVWKCSRTIYEVAEGIQKPVSCKAESIPMIAY